MATLTYLDIANHLGWTFNSQITFYSQIINFTEERFIDTILHTVFCAVIWTILLHLQFKYNLLTRLVGNDGGKAADFLAYIIIYSGCTRNYAFSEALTNNHKFHLGLWDYLIIGIGYSLIVFGLVLIAFSFYRLGLRGMYFGDHFGFLFKEKVISFPYNIFENPQYIGSCSFFYGMALSHLSPAGICLSLLINSSYYVLNYFESKKLAIFYPPEENKTKENKQE